MKITAWLPASIFFLGIFIHALVYIIPANTDLVDGRHSLHMDERITFDQTYEIVSSASPKALITNFVGNDFRYGRLTFAFPAAISWLPFSFFGDKGLIIGNRTFFYLVVLSVSFFVFFFAGINFLGALGGLAVLTAPYSDYYSTMP